MGYGMEEEWDGYGEEDECSRCDGSGDYKLKSGKLVECFHCEGSGQEPEIELDTEIY